MAAGFTEARRAGRFALHALRKFSKSHCCSRQSWVGESRVLGVAARRIEGKGSSVDGLPEQEVGFFFFPLLRGHSQAQSLQHVFAFCFCTLLL